MSQRILTIDVPDAVELDGVVLIGKLGKDDVTMVCAAHGQRGSERDIAWRAIRGLGTMDWDSQPVNREPM